MKRRHFFKGVGLASLPLIAGLPLRAGTTSATGLSDAINFALDGYVFDPEQYIAKLQQINSASRIVKDNYSRGGAVEKLEKNFARITKKEAAVYMPTGTMANQLAVRLHSGDKTKVIVHEASHIFRDEGDAAQAVHNKRLVPIATKNHFFSAKDLTNTIDTMVQGEVFYDGVGALSVESPNRRHDGKIVGLDHIQEVSSFAKRKGIKTHLDGARLHLASAYSGVSVAEYSAYFDTVYVSLYKYLGAGGGGILCGDSELIDRMHHYIKILGGTILNNWTNAAMANHFLDGLDGRLSQMVEQSKRLMARINELDELKISGVPNGTNIHFLTGTRINLEAFANDLNTRHQLLTRPPQNNSIRIQFNETLLLKTNDELIRMIKESILRSK